MADRTRVVQNKPLVEEADSTDRSRGSAPECRRGRDGDWSSRRCGMDMPGGFVSEDTGDFNYPVQPPCVRLQIVNRLEHMRWIYSLVQECAWLVKLVPP